MFNKNFEKKEYLWQHFSPSTRKTLSRLQRTWSEFDSGLARLTWRAVDFQNNKPRWRLPGFKRNTTFGNETVLYVSCPWTLGVVELEV